MVNDFGSVNIDAALVANRDGKTISLTNGCVCCSHRRQPRAHAARPGRAAANGPEHVVIEASGVADPGKIAHYGRDAIRAWSWTAPSWWPMPKPFGARADDKYVGDLVRQQLAAADVIVLSKTDLVDAGVRSASLRHWIESRGSGGAGSVATLGAGLIRPGLAFAGRRAWSALPAWPDQRPATAATNTRQTVHDLAVCR